LALETHHLSAGKNHPPEAEPSGGCLKFFETEKLGVRLSHNVSGNLLFYRTYTGVQTEEVQSLLDFFLGLLVELFLDPFFVEEYPSAYHPPPTSLNEQGDMIFLALRLHLGHLIALVPIGTRLSVTVPSGHWNS
jgi:hypothetical protein